MDRVAHSTLGYRRIALAAGLAGSLTFASPAVGAPHVRVHAATTIDAHVSHSEGKLLFLGTLADDAGLPLAGQRVTVALSVGSEEDPAPLAPCPAPAPGDAIVDRARPGTAVLRSDQAGRFCIATTSSDEKAVAHFEWAGSPFDDRASVDVVSDPSRRQVDLRLASDPVVDLASDSFSLRVTARIADEGTEFPAGSLALLLTNEAGAEIARAITSATGLAFFVVAPSRVLGSPGRGELRVDFAGDASTSAVRRAVAIERRVEVRLTLAGPSNGASTLSPADPEDGVTLPILATTSTGDPVSVGIVEASVEGRVVGAAPVQAGRADLVATFPFEGATSEIQVRYAGDAPWYVPGPGVTVRLPIAARNPWRRALLLLASVGVVLWLALGRTRRRIPLPSPLARQETPPGRARVHVVRAAEDSRVGWTGRVIDAHEATGVAGAEVRVERPTFGKTEVLASVRTNDAGRFELRSESARRGDRLVVSAPLHSTLKQNVAAFGQLEIAIVQRRRALVDRLVAWARRRGGPFDRSPEPTPGHVARVARVDSRTRAWAEAVERAGFGPDVVDALAEDEVERMAPQNARDNVGESAPIKR